MYYICIICVLYVFLLALSGFSWVFGVRGVFCLCFCWLYVALSGFSWVFCVRGVFCLCFCWLFLAFAGFLRPRTPNPSHGPPRESGGKPRFPPGIRRGTKVSPGNPTDSPGNPTGSPGNLTVAPGNPEVSPGNLLGNRPKAGKGREGNFRMESHSLETPVGSADLCSRLAA